jgi:2-C-methyl-D-erythritol 4-phosphate cytidylyltransferase
MSKPRYWLIVPAAGSGQRMKADCPKQYLRLDHQYILDITLSRLLDHADFSGCVVAIRADDPWWPETAASSDARIESCDGGAERADSVVSALEVLASRANDDDWVLVHDAARPCLHPNDLERLMTQLQDHPVGGLLATPVADTLKRVASDSNQVETTVDRRHLWRALTPQMFRCGTLRQALKAAIASGYPVTDESSAMEYAGNVPCIVEGRPDNIKITVPADLALAGFILSHL